MKTSGRGTLGRLARAAGHLARVALVAAGMGPGAVATAPERADVVGRIERIRARLQENAAPAKAAGDSPEARLAQWGNWGNWGNYWNNWANWNNWRNWGNWGNWGNV